MTAALDALPKLPLSPKQIASIVEALEPNPHGGTQVAIWAGAIRAGKTTASIVAFFLAVAQAPETGLILICGRTLQTIERNIIEPMQDPVVYGPLAGAVQHTRGSSTAVIFGRTVHLIGAADARAEGKLRGLTACLAMVDEATLMPEEFWTQLIGRLSVKGARLYATTNPASGRHWLKRKFIDKRDELGYKFWNFTMHDNPSLEPEWIAQKERELAGIFYARNILGRWVGAEGGVYDMFDPDTHIIKWEDLPDMQSIISVGIDFGATNPTCAVIFGLGVDNKLYAIDEWYHKNSSFEASWSNSRFSREIIDWINSSHHPRQHDLRPKYVLLDPSAKPLRTQMRDDGLKTRAASNAVLPGIGVVQNLFSENKLFISDRCQNLLNEIPEYRWDPKATERGEDAVIKVDDHACFAAGTLVEAEDGPIPIEQITPGTRVWTREGLRPVVDAGLTAEAADVVQVEFSDGSTLICTPNHPIYVSGSGFRRADILRYGDKVAGWKRESKPSVSTASSSVATPTRPASPTAATTPPASEIGSEATSDSTKRSGCTPTELTASPKATTSTTSITTTTTMTRRTSNSSAPKSITSIMRRSVATILNGWSLLASRWTTPASSRLNGMAPKMDSNGIASTVRTFGRSGKLRGRSSTFASSAAQSLNSLRSGKFDSAPTSANLHGDGHLGLTTLIDHARTAVRTFASTSTPRRNAAPVHVVRVTALQNAQPVFNLTVSGQPEYYANGILVHNCDAARYGIYTTLRTWWKPVMGNQKPLDEYDETDEKSFKRR